MTATQQSQNSALTSSLRTAISTASTKSADVQAGTFEQSVAADRAASARSRVTSKQNEEKALLTTLDNILALLNPPPTKEVSDGKGKTKTVVDTEEVRKLEIRRNSTQAQINQARADVSVARDEADTASTQALTAAGVTQQAQSEMQGALSSISDIETTLQRGGTVSQERLQTAITSFNTVADSNQANIAGAVSKAFYNPAQASMRNILSLITQNPNLITGAAGTGSGTVGTGSGAAATSSGTAATGSATAANSTTAGGDDTGIPAVNSGASAG
jgi:hypothetical protein